jgi:hypothetical protein
MIRRLTNYLKGHRRSIKKVHLIHIPKTGGSALKVALSQQLLTERYQIVLHRHSWTLNDLKNGEYVMFFIRDPISRFVSAFFSRLREGRPRYHVPWSIEESRAFELFPYPSALAESLSSSDLGLRSEARHAMCCIKHVKSPLARWLISPAYLLGVQEQILFVGSQESLNEDFEFVKHIVGLHRSIMLPISHIEMHKRPEYQDPVLSELAIENLAEWFKEDFEFLNVCAEIRQMRMTRYDQVFRNL